MGINERKIREKERRRNEIIDAATDLFIENGVQTATMDAIARRAELSKGTLYLYFKSKEDIHYAIVNKALDIISGLFRKHYVQGASGLENLKHTGDAYIDFYNQHTEYFNLIAEFHSANIEKVDEEERKKLLCEDSPLMFVSQVIAEGQQDGSIRDDISALELTMILWSKLNGVLEFLAFRSNLMELFGIQLQTLIQNTFKIIADGLQK